MTLSGESIIFTPSPPLPIPVVPFSSVPIIELLTLFPVESTPSMTTPGPLLPLITFFGASVSSLPTRKLEIFKSLIPANAFGTACIVSASILIAPTIFPVALPSQPPPSGRRRITGGSPSVGVPSTNIPFPAFPPIVLPVSEFSGAFVICSPSSPFPMVVPSGDTPMKL